MKRKIFFAQMLIAMFWFTSCQKDIDIFIPSTSGGLDTNWVTSVTDLSPVSEIKKLLKPDDSLDSVDAAAGGTCQSSEGLSIIVLPNSLQLSNGQTASGKIHVETFLVKQKGDMIRLDKPTTSFGRILVSGGEIFVKIRKDNEELHLAPGKTIYIKYKDNNPSSLMKLFYGDESNIERFNWIPSTLNNGSPVGVTAQGYEFVSDRLRWLNCDYFADSLGARVNVAASLPADFTNANTSVYLVFKDIKSVAGMYGDNVSKRFLSPKVQSGKSVIIVSITKKGTNSYYLGHEFVTTGQSNLNGIQTIPLKPQPTSLSDIKAYLATL